MCTPVLMLLMGIAALFFSAPGYCDVVQMNNGDRISGYVTLVSEEKLTILTEYAGEITLSMDAVFSIETDEARVVVLSDESIVEGVLIMEEGQPGIGTAETWRPLPATSIIALAKDQETLTALMAPAPPRRWTGTVDAGVALRSGNTDTTDLKFSVALNRAGDRDTLKMGFTSAYGAADGTINTRRYAGNFRWQYYMRERLYLYTLGLAERDDGRKLDLRLQGGGGFGYELVKRDRTTLAADIGLTYTHERWMPFTPWERDKRRDETRLNAYNRLYQTITRIGEEGFSLEDSVPRIREVLADIRNPLRDYVRRTEDYMNLRIGVHFTQTLFKTSKLSEELTLMPNLEQLGEFRALSELAITTPVTDAISLRTSLKTEYDSLARRKEIDAWDHTLMTEFRYSF